MCVASCTILCAADVNNDLNVTLRTFAGYLSTAHSQHVSSFCQTHGLHQTTQIQQ